MTKPQPIHAVLATVTALLVVGGISFIAKYLAWQNERAEAEADCRSVAAGYKGHDLKSGPLKVDAVDKWGSPMRGKVTEGDWWFTVVVSSAGPDKTFDTRDDVSSTEIVKTKIAENAGKQVGGASARAAKGFIQGVKKEIKKGKKAEEEADVPQ
jgi:hypothetical protein